jgi:hypothetical protein
MIPSNEVIHRLGPEERRWLARCQIVAVLIYVTIFAGGVAWVAVDKRERSDATVASATSASVSPDPARTPEFGWTAP